MQRVQPVAPPFWVMLAGYFGLSAHEQRQTWQAITKARWSTTVAWRQAVWLLDARHPTTAAVATFLEQHTPPRRVLEVLEGLVLGPIPTLILVANSKKGEMILFTPTSEDQRNGVDSWAEMPTSVGESRLERIRHQYQPFFPLSAQADSPQKGFSGGQRLPRHRRPPAAGQNVSRCECDDLGHAAYTGKCLGIGRCDYRCGNLGPLNYANAVRACAHTRDIIENSPAYLVHFGGGQFTQGIVGRYLCFHSLISQ